MRKAWEAKPGWPSAAAAPAAAPPGAAPAAPPRGPGAEGRQGLAGGPQPEGAEGERPGALTAQQLDRLHRLAVERDAAEAEAQEGCGPPRYRVRIQEPLSEASSSGQAASNGREDRPGSRPRHEGGGRTEQAAASGGSAGSGGSEGPSGGSPQAPQILREAEYTPGPLPFVGGPGKMHFWVPDHIRGGVGESDPPGSHGHAKDLDYQDGLERGIGQGRRHLDAPGHLWGGVCVEAEDEQEKSRSRRRYIAAADHIYGGTAADDPPGSHGHVKDAALHEHIPRHIGHGKHHIPVQDHIVAGSAVVEKPGLHGHNRDDDFEEGIQRGIGHGRRHLESGLEAYLRCVRGRGRLEAAGGLATPPKTSAPPRSASAPGAKVPGTFAAPPAGLPSRFGAWGGAGFRPG